MMRGEFLFNLTTISQALLLSWLGRELGTGAGFVAVVAMLVPAAVVFRFPDLPHRLGFLLVQGLTLGQQPGQPFF